MKLWDELMARFRKPDPLREELRRNLVLTEQLCETMHKFEATVIDYHSRRAANPNYGRRAEDDTVPRRA